MWEISSDLSRFVSWKEVSTFWLQLIWTPDTEKLVLATAEQIQKILNLWMENWYPRARDEVVSTMIFDSYWHFKCWESISSLKKSVRWKHNYLFSDPSGNFKADEYSLNDKLLSDLFLLNSIKDNGARTSNAVVPCMPYARQDKTTPKKRQSASIDLLWDWFSRITWENWYVIDMQLHNPTSKSAFRGTQFIDLYSGWMVEKVISELKLQRTNTILSPADQWWLKTVEAIAKDVEVANIVVIKGRDYTKQNTVDKIEVFWNIEWRDVIIFDDMLDTGWTMAKLLEEMLNKNPKSINVIVSHGMFNGEAYEILSEVIEKSKWVIQNIYISDSINKVNPPDFVKILSMKNLLANTITWIYKWFSVDRGDNKDYALT